MKNYLKITLSFILLFTAAQANADLSEVSQEPVYIVKNLVRDVQLNGMPAMALGSAREDSKGVMRIPVLIWADRNLAEFKITNIRADNLRVLKPYPDREKTLEEIIAELGTREGLSSFHNRPLSFPEENQLKDIASLLGQIVPQRESTWQDKHFRRWRLMGAYLAENHGMWGMRLVIKSFGPQSRGVISATWDKLGNWRH